MRLEKRALSAGTLKSYLGQRAAQGVGGAAALGKVLPPTSTSRQAMQQMGGFGRYQLKGVMEGGQALRKSQQLPQRVGLGPETAATRTRVMDAIKHERTVGGTRTGGVPLSSGYEGYVNTVGNRSYNPAHVEHVMGLPAGSHVTKTGPTALMRPGSAEHISVDATTPAASVPSVSGIRPVSRGTVAGATNAGFRRGTVLPPARVG